MSLILTVLVAGFLGRIELASSNVNVLQSVKSQPPSAASTAAPRPTATPVPISAPLKND